MWIRFALLFGLGCTPARSADPSPEAPADRPLRQAAQEAGLEWPLDDVTIQVSKRDRSMEVRSSGITLVSWPVALGGVEADKVREGDRATPEGDFRVVTRNGKSQFHRFLGLSYPNTEDAERGVRDGLISEAEARQIRLADAAGRVPPWNTKLGGAIGLHGGGGSADWTLGCVAVENAQIEEIWEVAPHGTRVEIRP